MNLAGKVAIVTGAGTGIGRELSRALLRRGARVVLVGRRKDKLEEAGAGFPNATLVSADVSRLDELREIVRTTTDKYGSIDVVVNNAGIVYSGPVESITPAEVEYLNRVNVLAPIWLTQLALPILKQRPEGMLVYTGSIASLVQVPYQSFYCATKHALRGFAESIRRELLGSNVKVVTVYPGNVSSEIISEAAQSKIAELNLGRGVMSAEAAAEIITSGMESEASTVFVANSQERALVRLNHLVPGLVDRRMAKMSPKIRAVVSVMNEWTRSRNVLIEP